MTISTHFAHDYAEARRLFLDAARGAGAAVQSIQHPLRGPAGERLFCDAAWLGPREAERVFVTISATHGIEGFCGSGCQVAWFAAGLGRETPDGVALLAIHAINPHGFAWLRRVTEDNVDLNRNFVDFARALPASPAYDSLHDAICPSEWTDAARAAAAFVLDSYSRAHGPMGLQAAVSSGQYSHPDGLFFGGHAPTWSRRTLKALFERQLARARQVAVVDFHTGLGPRGHGEVIAGLPPDDPGYARMRAWLGDDVRSPELGTSASPPLNGTNGVGMRQFLRPGALTEIAIEYGTLPQAQVMDSLRADNWLHFHGDLASNPARRIKTDIRAAFAPEDATWREQVWDRAVDVSRRMIRGLAET